MDYFKVLSKHLARRTYENHEKLQAALLASSLRYLDPRSAEYKAGCLPLNHDLITPLTIYIILCITSSSMVLETTDDRMNMTE
jgi:hypothetical protein